MKYKDSDPFKVVVVWMLVIMLFLQVAMLIWAVRRDQRESIERSARIAQFQAGWCTYEPTANAPEWICMEAQG